MERLWSAADNRRSRRARPDCAAEALRKVAGEESPALETQQAAAGCGSSAARPSLTRLETRTKESMVGVRGQMKRSEPAAKASSVSKG